MLNVPVMAGPGNKDSAFAKPLQSFLVILSILLVAVSGPAPLTYARRDFPPSLRSSLSLSLGACQAIFGTLSWPGPVRSWHLPLFSNTYDLYYACFRIKEHQVDYVVVATGLFNTPARPSWASAEALSNSGFTGQVIDAQDFTHAKVAKVRV